MGKTNPTYRDQLRRLEEDWQPFRRALRVQYHDEFDQLFDDARQFADAAGIQNEMAVMEPFLISVMLAQECRIREIEDSAGND
ncbi:hypothetical protein [Natrinema halophilum]|uniref:DUF8156 domain-containing protein n=1 Tax=Natrinema halophilum TaxID=1699371 RepID=A0A7D5KQX2_9EURY|nr:hypothetical protein [Natrinema halophilum]QLG47884.1 hypothetical protein HYG82_03000 [Natrinema halophilum]